MKQLNASVNPFTVQTPEDIDAADAYKLFVDVFTDFYKIREPGHSMLNGPRGCGKSMMFRYLQPDCQMLKKKCSLHELDFYAILVSIKNTALNLTEFDRITSSAANIMINEHFLTMFVCSKAFVALSKECIPNSQNNIKALNEFYSQKFLRRLQMSGWVAPADVLKAGKSVEAILNAMASICDDLYTSVLRYVKLLSFNTADQVYTGPLCGYIDFLHPLFAGMSHLPFMPRKPIYLLIDDADFLNHTQTHILNSWLATRTSKSVSIKVSTQLKYKSFTTPSGMTIESPHDFSEVNVTDLYTSSKSRYLKRVEEIIEKRLRAAGLKCLPRDYFPVDKAQEAEIQKIAERLRKDWETSGKGNRPSDDVVRYARPSFIANLGGKRKASSKYSYAGFEQLVHISSGLVRYFLEPAAQMFAIEQANAKGKFDCISPKVQNDVIRINAESMMASKYEEIFKEECAHLGDPIHLLRLGSKKVKLHNLIRGLGGLFHAKLISNDSERRVFSVAFSDNPGNDVLELFDLGIQFGYFHKSSIGNKDGTGRTPLYVLTRRLAPYFNLDPNGFAGYVFITGDKARAAIDNPDSFLRQVKSKEYRDSLEARQLQLFD